MLCRCPDQIHPVVFGDSAVYQFSRSHLLVREKGRNLYKKPFAFQSENWYVFFTGFGCETTCAQHLFCCRVAGKEPSRFHLRHQTCSCAGKPCNNIPLQPLVPLATVAVEAFTRRLNQRSSTVINGRNGINGCFPPPGTKGSPSLFPQTDSYRRRKNDACLRHCRFSGVRVRCRPD